MISKFKLCNDRLTRVRTPSFATNWPCPRTYQVGDKGQKNGTNYTIEGFRIVGDSVWMKVRFVGARNYTSLLIGAHDSFSEKLVKGEKQ